MSKNRYDRSQLLYFRLNINQRRFISIIHFKPFKNIYPTLSLWEKFVHDLLFQDICAILPILYASFHEGPTIDIANIGFSICAK